VYGEIPANYLGPLQSNIVEEVIEGVSMFDYEPENEHQIGFKFGDILELHSRDQEGEWWFGCVIGMIKSELYWILSDSFDRNQDLGLFPSKFRSPIGPGRLFIVGRRIASSS